ncbi:MAG TPA: histidine phosphatase family protein [Acidimicrobiales bacterium]|nr:histidine phosphatase family protein [Acidimicrobiales bacterium]
MTPEADPGRQLRFERPPGATSILLVRHGESVPARPGVLFPLVGGHGDPELDPAGVEQAERLAGRLSRSRHGEKISAIYVTNLRRTAETAAPLAAALGMEVRVEADLREVHLGEWEGGLYRIKMREGGPIVHRLLEEGRWDVIPGAESDASLIGRIRAGIGRIAAAHPDELVAVFTHGGVIGRIVAEAAGSRPLSFAGANNGSISEIVVAAGHWVIRCFNDTAHLEDL